jgi:hypothetical protein
MKIFLALIAIALLASVALAEWHEFFNRPVAPPKWTRGHRASLQLPVSVTIGLQQQNLDWLDVRAPPQGFCYFCVEWWLYFARMIISSSYLWTENVLGRV